MYLTSLLITWKNNQTTVHVKAHEKRIVRDIPIELTHIHFIANNLTFFMFTIELLRVHVSLKNIIH